MEKWNTEQIGFAIKCRNDGMSWSETANALYEAGYPKRSPSNVGGTIRRITKQYDVSLASASGKDYVKVEKKNTSHWKDDPATRKQCKYISALTLKNGSKKELDRLTNQLVTSANKGDFTKEQAKEMIDTLGGGKKPALDESNLARFWTPEEDAIVIEWKTAKNKYPPTELFEDRSYKAIAARWNRVLKYKQKEPRKEYVEEHKKENKPVTSGNASITYPNTQKAWTYDESLEAMVMWHSLPIDEAREKFGRPYWVIAKHVEKHYDFYYDDSETIMRRATEIKNNMKRNAEPKKKPSLLKRLKLRRIAKREKRLNRKLDKAVTKLSKLQKKVNIDGKF